MLRQATQTDDQNDNDGAEDKPAPSPPRLVAPPRWATTIALVGTSPGIRRLRREIAKLAPLSAPVVIYGDSGTGKERVARALHDYGQNPRAPFVAVNCGAFDRNLLSSELFGHERGAFTTAVSTRRGLLERASGGTLFLDEVAELPLDAQAMLLRVLETGETQRLGGDVTRQVRFRVIAATHRSLAKLVTAGAFRADLFWRLFVVVLHVPPLSRRAEDIPLLAAELLDELAPEIGERELDDSALELLGRYSWPGNVRQMKTVLRRAAGSTQRARLLRADIAAAIALEPPELARLPKNWATAELPESTVRDALRDADGRLAPAARALGMPRTTLRDQMRRLGINR